ncbi:major facilitator superfamily transporter [Diaporthe eres]|nr:major facilitator superfamily transporter [Diaporthe eres]
MGSNDNNTTAIPSITSEFNTLNDIGWYGSAYLLASCALQPTYGKIFTYFHVKWTYLSALFLFEIGSVICATAPSSLVLIIGRAVAGLGGAGLTSGGSTIIAGSVPIRKRGLFNSSLASTFGIASVTGPLLGGVLTDKLSWRWCFWLNLPLGAVAFLVVVLVFKPPRRQTTSLPIMDRVLRLDFMGSAAFMPGIICLLLALQWGGTTYAWSDSRVWGTLLGFVLLIACFVGIQIYRKDNALIPPRIISQRTVLTSVLFQALLCMGIYAHFYYLPYYFQVVQGTDATQSGIRTIPYVASISLFAIIAGALVQLVGFFAPFLWLGAGVFTVAAGLMYTLELNSPQRTWIGFQVLAGAGAGTAFQMPLLAVQCSVAETDVPVGNAMVGFFMTLGSSISVSVAQNIFSNSLGRGLAAIPGLNPQQIIDAGATGVRHVTPPPMLISGRICFPVQSIRWVEVVQVTA